MRYPLEAPSLSSPSRPNQRLILVAGAEALSPSSRSSILYSRLRSFSSNFFPLVSFTSAAWCLAFSLARCYIWAPADESFVSNSHFTPQFFFYSFLPPLFSFDYSLTPRLLSHSRLLFLAFLLAYFASLYFDAHFILSLSLSLATFKNKILRALMTLEVCSCVCVCV